MKLKSLAGLTFWSALAGIVGLLQVHPATGQQAVPVIAAPVNMDRFVDRVEVLGTLRANESVEVTATVSETVTVIHFEDGQRVAAGDILVEMTSEEEHALIEEALSTVTEAGKQLERVQALAARGSAPVSLLDQRRREYDTASARLRAIESKMKDRLVLAPFSGVVGLRNISVGALIEPGDLITTLDDDSVMKLDFSVPAVYLTTLRVGLPVQARSPAFAGRTFNGTVSSVDSRIDPVTRSVTARAIVPNPERLLKPGLLMHVDLLKSPREVPVVSEEALIPTGRENHVLVIDRSTSPAVVQRRKVVIGNRRPGAVEILEGLSAGELVVVHGTTKASPGQAVTVISEKSGDEPLRQLLERQADRADR